MRLTHPRKKKKKKKSPRLSSSEDEEEGEEEEGLLMLPLLHAVRSQITFQRFLYAINLPLYTRIRYTNSFCVTEWKRSGCRAHITWIRVASCERALLADVPSAGLFSLFPKARVARLVFKSSLLEHSLPSLNQRIILLPCTRFQR